MESNLKLYSLGIVVETKPPGTDLILVSPIEVLNIQKPGDIKLNNIKFEGTLKDINNNNFKSEHNAKNYLRAKWLPYGHSNRITSPDVVANETVLLFKFSDVDEYYWTTIFREVELRRLETVMYGFSNIRSGISPFDKSTSYWLEVDTRNKLVRFHTAMNDGEYTEYDIIVNTKLGTLTIKDKKNNYIHIDSQKDNIVVNSNKDINAVAGNSITATANNSVTIKSPIINLQGNVKIIGNVSTTGSINATGSIIDQGGNTNHHSH